MELELTFLARDLPAEISQVEPRRLVDVYIPEKLAVHPRLRLRQKGTQYEVTKKLPSRLGDASSHIEHTIDLDADEFECLQAASRRRVQKDRFVLTLEGSRAEVDVFRGDLAGLVLIDFEFDSEAEMASFSAPACCGADVTQEDFIAGGLLAGRTYADIEQELAKFDYSRIG